MRRILHIDMDAFFAAIEQQRRPELRGRPVVVGGRGNPEERGVVSTASYEARRFGIHSAMPLRTAFRLCPGAVFLSVDFRAYRQVAERVREILHEVSPTVEEAGIDEAYLDLSGLDVSSEEIARTLKRRIRQATGLSCSVGIGPNKLLAKIAAGLEKPDGFTVLVEADVPGRLWPLPVRSLPGVGPKTGERLARKGIFTIGELAALPLEALATLFGPAHGAWLAQAARGIDDSPLLVNWEPKSFSRETTFQKDMDDFPLLAAVVSRLSAAVAARLRRGGWRGRTVTVKLRYADFETHTRALTLEAATDRTADIREAAGRCLERFPLDRRVRLLGVRISGLEKEAGR